MKKQHYLSVRSFCEYHNIEISFIDSLIDLDLLTVVIIDEVLSIDTQDIGNLERMIRLYKELKVNPEGVHAILHLLKKIKSLVKENDELKSRLKLYES